MLLCVQTKQRVSERSATMICIVYTVRLCRTGTDNRGINRVTSVLLHYSCNCTTAVGALYRVEHIKNREPPEVFSLSHSFFYFFPSLRPFLIFSSPSCFSYSPRSVFVPRARRQRERAIIELSRERVNIR